MLVRMPPNKSHFEAFCFLRTSSLQRRRYAEQQQGQEEEEETEDAAARLLSCEAGGCDEVVTPAFAGRLEGLNYQLGRLDEKLEQLVELHTAQLARPGLEESSQEERRISVQTTEITQQVSQCGQQLRGLQSQVAGLVGRQQTLLQNIVINLARRLQDITEKFRRRPGRLPPPGCRQGGANQAVPHHHPAGHRPGPGGIRDGRGLERQRQTAVPGKHRQTPEARPRTATHC